MPATANSAPEVDPGLDVGGDVERPGRTSVVLGAGVALLVAAMAAIMFASHRSGHWWGDDWALYLRQAQSLIDGDPGRVASANEFTITASRGAPFTPPLYPWGFPALLAPFVAVFGADLDRLAIVPVLSTAVFAICWFDLVRRRLGTTAGLLAMVALTLSPLLLGWTELIQSEWPFMAATSGVLVALDRIAAGDRLLGRAARLGPLVLLGVGVAASFSIRREGIGLVVAVATAQLVAVVAAVADRRLHTDDWGRVAVRLVAPHASALAVVLAVQASMPSTLVPSYRGTGPGNIWRFRGEHVEHLAEIVGLKRPWDADTVVLGSSVLGIVAVAALGLAALVGWVLAIGPNRRRDAYLAAYAVVAFVVGASFRVAVNRYVCTVAPILLLLALVAIRHVVEHRAPASGRRRSIAAAVPLVVLAAIVAGNLANANVRLDRAREFAAAGSIEWGPVHPAAVEMFAQVDALAAPDDVVAAPKARAMAFETGRRTIQVDEYRPLPTDPLPALVVTERRSEINADLRSAPGLSAYESVWANAHFEIFRATDR